MAIILKQTKESMKKGNYGLIPFMNINAKVLNKILLNIMSILKIPLGWTMFILGIQIWLNIKILLMYST